MISKIKFSLATVLMFSALSAQARVGDDNPTGNEQIVCKDQRNSAVVLQFAAVDGQGHSNSALMQIDVTTFMSDIASMTLLDHRSGDAIRVEVADELVVATLTSAGMPAVVKQSGTHRGAATLSIQNPTTGDSAAVQSNERRGESRLSIELATTENAGQTLNIVCEKVR